MHVLSGLSNGRTDQRIEGGMMDNAKQNPSAPLRGIIKLNKILSIKITVSKQFEYIPNVKVSYHRSSIQVGMAVGMGIGVL